MSRDIVVVGGSAGGLEPLRALVGALPSDLAAAVFVVVHGSRDTPGFLPQILRRAGPLPAKHAVDGAVIEHGRIYVAPPDHHLLLEDGRMRVTSGPRENGFRPAVDPLFRTAAHSCGSRVIGVVLSGGLDDGTYGLSVIKQQGGLALVQDVKEAAVPSMPASAIRAVAVDHVLGAVALGELIGRVAQDRVPEVVPTTKRANGSSRDAAVAGTHDLEGKRRTDPPSPFRCPDCGGALWKDGGAGLQARFTCHVGHAFSTDGLLAGHARGVETALWVAVRALEEQAALHRRMASRAHEGGMEEVTRSFQGKAAEAEHRARSIRRILLRQDPAVSLLPGASPAAPAARRRPIGTSRRPSAEARHSTRQ